MKIQSVASAIDSSESNVISKSESDPVSESLSLSLWLSGSCVQFPQQLNLNTGRRITHRTHRTQGRGHNCRKKREKKRRCGINEKQLTCSANKQTRHNNYAKKEAVKDNRRHAAATTTAKATTTTITGSTYVPAYQDNYGDSNGTATEGQHSAAFRA